MNTLYIELIGTVVLASLIGLGTGWLMQRARAARKLRRTVAVWEKRCSALQPADAETARSLQEQLRSLDQLLGAESARTRELETQLGATNNRLEKARGDAIRLNSQQAGVQERLQRIIREKDQELAELRQRTHADRAPARTQSPAEEAAATVVATAESDAKGTSARMGAGDEIEAYIDRLSDRGARARPGGSRAPGNTAGATDVTGATEARAHQDARDGRQTDTPTGGQTGGPTDHAATSTARGDAVESAPARQPPEAEREPPVRPSAEAYDDYDDYDDPLDDTLDATAVIDMASEHDVQAAPGMPDPMDATGVDGRYFDEDTLAFEEDTIAFDDDTLARVRKRSNEG